LARQAPRRSGTRRHAPRNQRPAARRRDNEGILPVLARAVREVETAVQRGSVMGSVRTKFQVIALLVREERARVNGDATLSEAVRSGQLKRLDGIATILAQTAARDTSLLSLLAEDANISDSASSLRREMLESAGLEAPPEEEADEEAPAEVPGAERRVDRRPARGASAPARGLGAARTALPILRVRRQRGGLLHAAAGA
jgi:hypothetical protein